jgi:NAD(P)-dependent dehydrogenase (short-subunit alcohol dehydrogenase family)
MNLDNRSALITGGSQGLGLALAHALASAGARVALVARGRTRLDAAVASIRAVGGQAFGIAADLGDKHAIHRITGEATALLGPIDLLVNNASTLGPTPLGALLDTECEDLERVLQVNVVGPFRLTKVIAGSMALRGTGVVVNISSDAAVEAYPTWGAYSASKAALDQLTRVWAAELADTGVRMISVDPGEMNTGMHAAAMPEADPSTLAEPRAIAARIVAMLRDAHKASTGSRQVAPAWEVAA